MADQTPQRPAWDRFGGAVVAALGIVVLVVAVVALRHPQGHSATAGTPTRTPTRASVSVKVSSTRSPSSPASSSATATSTPTTPATSASSSVTPGGKLPLVVLNNSAPKGSAGKAETAFEAGGWTVTSIGDLANSIVSTCAYYDPAIAGAQAAAEALQQQFPAIKRVEAEFAGLPAGPIVVVLTSDYVP